MPADRGLHAAVLADLGLHLQLRPHPKHPGRGRAARLLGRLLRERRAFYKEHGGVPPVLPARDPTRSFLEAIADALGAAYQMRAAGVPGAAAVYEATLAIAGSAARRWYWPVEASTARPDFRPVTRRNAA